MCADCSSAWADPRAGFPGRTFRQSYALHEDRCPFCTVGAGKLLADNSLAFLISDGFPVTEGHLLAIPRRHVADYFDLHQPERNALQRLLDEGRNMCAGNTLAARGKSLHESQSDAAWLATSI